MCWSRQTKHNCKESVNYRKKCLTNQEQRSIINKFASGENSLDLIFANSGLQRKMKKGVDK